jgi:hypothetical protein
MTVEQNSCQNIGVYRENYNITNQKKIRNAKIQQSEFTNKIFNKKTNEEIHSEQMQVVPKPESRSNYFTTVLHITNMPEGLKKKA